MYWTYYSAVKQVLTWVGECTKICISGPWKKFLGRGIPDLSPSVQRDTPYPYSTITYSRRLRCLSSCTFGTWLGPVNPNPGSAPGLWKCVWNRLCVSADFLVLSSLLFVFHECHCDVWLESGVISCVGFERYRCWVIGHWPIFAYSGRYSYLGGGIFCCDTLYSTNTNQTAIGAVQWITILTSACGHCQYTKSAKGEEKGASYSGQHTW